MEASFLIPLFLLILTIVIQVLFYFHDKNFLLGIAHETAALGASSDEVNVEMLKSYFSERVSNKAILFSEINQEISMREEEVVVRCNANKGKMSLQVQCVVIRTEPESYIRKIQKINKIKEGIGNQN